MIPNYKRPRISEYLIDILEGPMTDEDLDMLNYLENLEQENKQLKEEKKKLKNWLEENNKTIQVESMSGGIATYKKKFEAYEILDKIKELEEGVK